MAIAPQIQIPGYAAPRDLDFSPLAKLAEQWKANQQQQVQQEAIAAYAGGDPSALLRSGNMSLAQLYVQDQAKKQAAERDARDFAFRQSQAERDQRNADRSYGLQLRAANRADDPTPSNFVRDPNAPGGYRPIGPADPDYIARAAQAKARAEAEANGGVPEVGLTPAYGTTADGKVGAIQFSKHGKAIQTQLPDGFTLSKEPMRIDAGTHINLVDPITRQVVGSLPKNLAGAETAKVVGEETGKAQVALPTIMSNSQQILKVLDGIEKHPGKEYALGMYSKLPTIPGTRQADFRANLEQLRGQQFLQGFQSLKGSGAITEVEGIKAENAIARMQTAQSVESFNAGLNEFRDIVRAGMLRAAAKARNAGSGVAPAQPAASSNDPLAAARDAIARGADVNAVRQRLQQNGIDPSGL